jgi:GR25 family glycosyltransferase involved in LPS biosynthesis
MLESVCKITAFALLLGFVQHSHGYLLYVQNGIVPFKTYWINLDRADDRRGRMENMLDQYGVTNHTRINAFDGRHFNRMFSTNHSVSYVSGHNSVTFPNSRGAWVDGVMPSPQECACALSHLKAIQRAYRDGSEIAIIFEDDVTFEHSKFWGKNETLKDLIVEAGSLEKNWGIIQLSWIGVTKGNESRYDRMQMVREYENGKLVARRVRVPQLKRNDCGGRVLWGAMSYAIRRDYMKTILDAYWPGGSVAAVSDKHFSTDGLTFSWMRAIDGNAPIHADCFIYSATKDLRKTLLATRPLFLYPEDTESTMTDRDDEQIKFDRREAHRESRAFIIENFYDVDIHFTRLLPKLYVINTGNEAMHVEWVQAALSMFEMGMIRDTEVLNAVDPNRFNKSSIIQNLHFTAVFDDMFFISFPNFLDRKMFTDVTTYMKAFRISYGDGFSMALVVNDTLPARTIQSIKNFNFPLATKRLGENEDTKSWAFGNIIFEGGIVGLLIKREAIGALLDYKSCSPGGAFSAGTPADGSWILSGHLDLSGFEGHVNMNAMDFILHNVLAANMAANDGSLDERKLQMQIEIPQTLA